jgi:nucleoside-diphosphate-sugar epimerase
LKSYDFDAVLDINSYTRKDVENLVTALGSFRDYIFISTSAVYPETLPQPFHEAQKCGPNSLWGAYGTNKLDAEDYLTTHVPQAYMLRPPYLYGPMEHVYRAPFVFDCAEADRPFYIPGDGSLKLQFFHVEDLCRLMQILLETHPQQRIYNVGNPEAISAAEWVRMCYEAAGKTVEFVSVGEEHSAGKYFCFPTYEYFLDVTHQCELLPDVKLLSEGFAEEYAWYRENRDKIARRGHMEYIDEHIR